jgi:hypothetical protein
MASALALGLFVVHQAVWRDRSKLAVRNDGPYGTVVNGMLVEPEAAAAATSMRVDLGHIRRRPPSKTRITRSDVFGAHLARRRFRRSWAVVLLSSPLIGSTFGLAIVGGGTGAESDYLSAVRAASPSFEATPDAKLLRAGYSSCESLRDGVATDDLVNAALGVGLMPSQVAAVTNAASTKLC